MLSSCIHLENFNTHVLRFIIYYLHDKAVSCLYMENDIINMMNVALKF